MGANVMAFKLSRFCRDAGAQTIADYFREVLGIPFPSRELPDPPLECARHIAATVIALPDDARRRAIADFQRIQKMCDPPGDEALSQIFDPGDWDRILKRHPSALHRALFCFWRWPEQFLNAEFRLSHKKLRRSNTACATHDCPQSRNGSEAALTNTARDALVSSVTAALADKMVPGSELVVQACLVRSEIGLVPERVFQIGVSWADGTQSQRVHGAAGVSQEMTDVARSLTLTFFPTTRRLQITGHKLSGKARDRLAAVFTVNVLGTFEPPVRAIPDLIRLEQCLAMETVRLPRRMSLESTGFDHIELVPSGSRRRQPVPINPGLTIRDGVARQLNAEFSQRKLPLSEIKKIRLLLKLHPGEGTSEVRVEITPQGFKCSSLLDGHDRLATEVLALNGILLRASDFPLIVGAAQ